MLHYIARLMASLDTDRLLEMLRDPNVESRDVAAATGVPREEAARAARLVMGLAKATAEDVLGLPAPLAVALARAAFAGSRVDLLAALAAHPGKDVAKEAKRGLHILKTRGVAVPEPPRPAPPPPAAAPEPPLPCYATVVDGQGERAVWIPRTVPGKGVEIAQAVLSDEQGLLELQLGVIGRKEWRKLLDGLLEKGRPMGLGELDRGRAVALVAAARALNDRSGQRVPEGADLWLGQLGPAEPVAEPPAPGPLPEAQEREALAASGALLFHPIFATWMADEAFLREVAAKLDEVTVSPLYVDERQRQEQLARTVADAVDRYLDDRRRAALVRRLEAVAGHLAGRGDADRASSAAAAARALAAGAPARTVPFARALVERAFPGVSAAPPPRDPPPPDAPLVVVPP
jgi:hypothetical protein